MKSDTFAMNSGTLTHDITLLLTEADIDDKEVSNVKWQDNDFRKQHNIEL